jgi:hypothetical protein
MGFEFLVAATMKFVVVCDVTPCTLVDNYQRLGGTY